MPNSILSRKKRERINIGEDVVLTVIRIRGGAVRLGIEAPRTTRVIRGELLDAIQRSKPRGEGEAS